MYTLGINATFHDSAACLVKDGAPLAAAEEERFTRIKHGKRPTPYTAYQLPFHAIDYCLCETGITMADLDHVAYSFDPHLLLSANGPNAVPLTVDPDALVPPSSPWDTVFLAGVAAAPRMLIDDVPFHLKDRFVGLKPAPPYQFHYVQHHLAHAASAFFVSPFDEAAILTIDGRGETTTTLLASGHGNEIAKIREIAVPHSLGLLYERLTEHLGFLHSSDEYKVMALASYGEPTYLGQFRDLIVRDEGGYHLGELRLAERFGPPRSRGAAFEKRHFDVAASLQKAVEETVLDLAAWLHRVTGSRNLCLAGGVALNCVLNARLRDDSPFESVWVQPAASDSGTALGAAMWIDRQAHPTPRSYIMTDACLGPGYDDERIRVALDRAGLAYERPTDIARAVAEAIARGKVVGWFQGRLEYGPRALGGRSILADPRDLAMVQRLNALKDREDFRPVAPAVLEEATADYFERACVSPFMLFTFPVRPDKAHLVPAICHIDGSARIQTVNRADSPLYHHVIEDFGELTGVPVVINTSFNTRGQPIVCTPEDAIACFFTAPIDVLAIGPFLLTKSRPTISVQR